MIDGVKSAIRVLEILEFLGRCERPVGLKDIVAELGYPSSSAFALLQTLCLMGYVVQTETHLYAMHEDCRRGPGWIRGAEAQLVAVARPLMAELRDRTGETVFLGMRARDGRVRVVAKETSEQAIRYDAKLDSSDPAYCTAMGRVLLAFWDERSANRYLGKERLIRYTKKTVTGRAEIKRILSEVRQNGYAICDEELEIGGSGAAAPVYGAKGEVVAALDIATVTARFRVKREQVISEVCKVATALSRRAGWTG